MSNKHLSRKPYRLEVGTCAGTGETEAWMYEDSHGFDVLMVVAGRTGHVLIPWKKIRAALKRKAKPDGE